MQIIVKKFGGTSVENVERIKRVAQILAQTKEKVIVVVSAMAGMTNQLVEYTRNSHVITSSHAIAEYDVVISAGEQITIGLVSLALISLGLKSRSYLGWQVPIITNDDYSQARILSIPITNLMSDLENGIIPVIAGFQGVANHRITTLGRGGSDTTAVAVAAAVNADRCDIYTDVNGIYTADPRIVTRAKKIEKIDYESALKMASSGAKVIHPRAVEIAMNNHLKVKILNTFSDDSGTEISHRKITNNMEKTVVHGIAVKRNLSMMTLYKVQEINGILKMLNDHLIPIESLSQCNVSFDGHNMVFDCNIVISDEYLDRAKNILSNHEFLVREHLSQVCIIGVGMQNDRNVMNTILNSIENVIDMRFLETQISFVVNQIHTDAMVRVLHTNLGLDTR